MTETTRSESSPESPWSVSRLSETIGAYIERLGSVWIEAEITQWGGAGGHIYGRMKDPDQDVTVDITVWRSVVPSLPEGIGQGDRVLARVRPSWYVKGGKLSMNVLELRHAGIGELLERIERLRKALQAEGLFDASRKKILPFLPQCIGLITGKDSDAEKDVLTNAARRWPDVSFRVEHSAVQGDRAVGELIRALDILEADPDVDVIIFARGGGDFQHLLPFSDETLLRRVAACETPVVSAIGHEADRPLLDEVADLRASTPTDAAKRVVPDVAEELRRLSDLRQRLGFRIHSMIDGEWERLTMFISRPLFLNPQSLVDRHAEDILRLVQRGVDKTGGLVEGAEKDVSALRSRVRTLSPLATLERGYGIVRTPAGHVVTDPSEVSPGDPLVLLVRGGTIHSEVTQTGESPDGRDT